MILAVDVCYKNGQACAAGAVFESFGDDTATASYRSVSPILSPYVSGSFYRRELPPIVRLIEEHGLQPDILIIDGYVFLDGDSKPGLGSYLYDYFNGKTVLIGVAKKRFRELRDGYDLYRGESRRPLFVTSRGIDPAKAKEAIASMAGCDRRPKLLKEVDRFARECCSAL
ncbi:endonuclease V [Hydrogenimonas sp.]|uniref:endonuclease V n=1 Tax=Hydrogenimonas sp. TaxID=2231112 RepID=UPI00260DE7CE|nr:endonuclease V [Hydrogenimonas sp.]